MWLIIAISGYFLNALAAIIDKILLGKSISNPRVYAFFIALLGMAAFILAPWGFSMVSWRIIWWSFSTGGLFVFSLLLFFTALKAHEASRVVPLIGAVQPLGIFLLSFFFLGERLSFWQLTAFVFLIIGGVIISRGKTEKKSFSQKWIIYALLGGICFAAFYTASKYIFTQETFINGFLWPRLGALAVALLLLLSKKTREDLRKTRSSAHGGAWGIFLLGQTSGALSFILINYAISLASVTLINALQGTQYTFVFLLALILAFKFPKLLKEKLTASVILQKTLALLLIATGIVLLNF